MQITLEIIGKKSNIKRVVLKESTLIGRAGECNLKVVSSQISRKHCRIDIESNRVTVSDLGSANGTFINDSQILPDEKIEISSGTTLRLGNVSFRVQFDSMKMKQAFEEEGSTLELAAYKNAENLKQVQERTSTKQTKKESVEVKEVEAKKTVLTQNDDEPVDISTPDVSEPPSVILEAVEDEIEDVIIEDVIIEDVIIEDVIIEDVIIEEEDEDEKKIPVEEDFIELDAVEAEPASETISKVDVTPKDGTKKDQGVSEDDVFDFLSDLDSSDAPNKSNPTEMKDFLDQFEN